MAFCDNDGSYGYNLPILALHLDPLVMRDQFVHHDVENIVQTSPTCCVAKYGRLKEVEWKNNK